MYAPKKQWTFSYKYNSWELHLRKMVNYSESQLDIFYHSLSKCQLQPTKEAVAAQGVEHEWKIFNQDAN